MATLQRTLGPRAPGPDSLTYVLESTAAYHYPVMLCFGGDACVVNPLLAHAGRRKTDRLDARTLAHQCITGTWKPSYTATAAIEGCRLILNRRRRLLKERTQLTNSLNNLVLRFGHTFAAHLTKKGHVSGGLYGPRALPIFEALAEGKLPNVKGISPVPIPLRVQKLMADVIARVTDLGREIGTVNRRLIAAVEETEFVCGGGELKTGKEIVGWLRTIPGVGPLLVCTWLCQVGDATRFKHTMQVAAFCGFDPSLMVSAGKVTAHTRRKGSKFLHYMIKQGAEGLVTKHKEALGQWGYAISRRHRKGGYNKAVGAVGRRMAIALWICHRDQVAFSYEKYDFWRAPDVPDVALEEMGFSPQMMRYVVVAGYKTSKELVAAYASGELAKIEGVGPRCLAFLAKWITKNRRRPAAGSSSAEPSSVGPNASSGLTMRKLSRTELCSEIERSTSTTGDPKATSTSGKKSKSP